MRHSPFHPGSWIWFIACTLALGGRPLLAQDVWLEIGSGNVFTHTFNRVASYEDITGDGIREFIIGKASFNTVRVVSGADGSVVHEVQGGSFSNGWTLAGIGDFDGDGVADFACGDIDYSDVIQSGGRAVVYSGATGQELVDVRGQGWHSEWGWALAGVGDVDGDGFTDIAVGGFYGDVHIFRGPNAALLRSHQGPGTRPSVAGIGDVDGDGLPDYVIGWPQDSTGGLWSGTAKVYSGVSGTLIHEVFGSIPQNWPHTTGDHLGIAVAGVGDLNGDGVPDFACGAPGEIIGPGGLQSRVLIYSGLDASLLREIDGNRDTNIGSWFGGALSGGGDVNGDGVPDLVVGAKGDRGPYITPGGSVSVYSGRTGARLWRTFTLQQANLGQYVAMVGDLDGDGLSEFASGDAEWQDVQGNRGRILVWRGARADARVVCGAEVNSVGEGAALEMGGSLGLSSHGGFKLIASGLPPLAPGLFFYGAPAAAQLFGEGRLCVGSPFFRLAPAQFADGAGRLERTLDLTSLPASGGAGAITPGATFTFQLWYRDPPGGPTGFNLSEALRATFAP